MKQDISEIKPNFETDDTPTQQQFYNWIESCMNFNQVGTAVSIGVDEYDITLPENNTFSSLINNPMWLKFDTTNTTTQVVLNDIGSGEQEVLYKNDKQNIGIGDIVADTYYLIVYDDDDSEFRIIGQIGVGSGTFYDVLNNNNRSLGLDVILDPQSDATVGVQNSSPESILRGNFWNGVASENTQVKSFLEVVEVFGQLQQTYGEYFNGDLVKHFFDSDIAQDLFWIVQKGDNVADMTLSDEGLLVINFEDATVSTQFYVDMSDVVPVVNLVGDSGNTGGVTSDELTDDRAWIFPDDDGKVLLTKLAPNINVITTEPQITGDIDNWNPTDLATTNLIRVDTNANNHEISGIVAPVPIGEKQVISITNLSQNRDIKFMHNNASSAPANRFLLRDANNKSIKPNETAQFMYDVTLGRWMPLNRVG